MPVRLNITIDEDVHERLRLTAGQGHEPLHQRRDSSAIPPLAGGAR